MTAIYDFLFSAGGYSPHGYCLAWEPGLLWLHVLSNGLIALAYFSIPIAIFRFVARRRDLPRRELAWLFAAFILSCGLTHVSAVATLFVPVYGLEGVLKAVTAAISLTAALGLFLLMPELLRIPSRSALMEANARLANEVRGRTRAEDALQAGKAAIEQRVAERTRILSESEERQRLALESAGYGVWDWQIGQDTVYWAETNRRLLGYSQAEFPNVLSSWRDRLHPEDLPALDAALERHLQSGDPFERRYRIRAADGTWRWWETRGSARRNAQGQPLRMLGVNRDVTDEVARADALAEAETAAQAASAAKTTFLAQMSHEIRTPMNGVIGMADLLRESTLDARQRSAVDTILHSAEALLAIVNDALDLAKIEAGELELTEAPFDLPAALEDVAALLGPVARGKGLTLVLDLDQTLPAQVVGDETRLRQIATNLLGNAIKFTERGHVVLRLAPGPETETIVIQVEDTGPGIQPALRDRIFDAFAQGPLRTAQEGGTGLGLAICQQLAEAMGGHVALEPTEGPGALFTCTLRLAAAPSAQPQTGSAHGAIPGAGDVVLVVDHGVKRNALARLMAQWGCEVAAYPDLASLEDACDGQARAGIAILDGAALGDEPLAALAQIITLGPAALGLLAGEDCEAVMALREAGLDETELPVCDEPVRPSALHTMLTALGADAAPADDADNAASGTMRRRGSRPASPRPAVDTRSDGTLRHPSAVVLVAEDNRINRLVIGRLLEGAVGEVLFAENGEEAVVLWRSHAPDLVLMDLQMPVLDGYGAARAIRAAEDEASRPRVPIVALTANVLQDDRGRCLDAGIDDFLDKPLRRETLLQRLDHWLPDQPGAGVGHTAA